MAQFRRIGILTSGGDAPGMNAAIRAAARAALDKGVEVYGIIEGYQGLIDGNMKLFTSARDLGNIVNKSGTFLYSARCDEFKTEEGMAKALKTCKDNQIDGIIAIGGDGTFRGATDLSARGIPTIGIPGTIDNDVTSTDVTIGFDTAMNTAMNMIDNLRDTCESHARCNVIEVMGRWAGHIALRTGIASGASAVAIAEVPFDEEAAIQKIIAQKSSQRPFRKEPALKPNLLVLHIFSAAASPLSRIDFSLPKWAQLQCTFSLKANPISFSPRWTARSVTKTSRTLSPLTVCSKRSSNPKNTKHFPQRTRLGWKRVVRLFRQIWKDFTRSQTKFLNFYDSTRHGSRRGAVFVIIVSYTMNFFPYLSQPFSF